MSDDFLWELEKLRRRFGVDRKEIEEAARALTRKRRGVKSLNDDRHLARLQAGATAREVADNIGGRGPDADQIRISRKNRNTRLQSQYWAKIEEISVILANPVLSQADRDIYMTRVTATAPPNARHLILMDIAGCCVGRVLDEGALSADHRDNLERALLHRTIMENIDLDSPVRRRGRASQIDALEQILQELRTKIT